MGMSEFYGPGDEAESDRHHPPGPRPRCHLPRHRRHVRPVPERGAGRPGDRRTPGRGGAGHQVRDRAHRRPGRALDPGRRRLRARRRARRRSAGSASTTSTSTTSTAAIPGSPSRRRWAPWPSWSATGKVRYLGLSEAAPDTLRRASRRPPDRRAAERVVAVEPGHRGRGGAHRPRARASASWPTARSAGGS